MQNNRTTLIAAIACFALFIGLQSMSNLIWPPKPLPPSQETAIALAGGAIVGEPPASNLIRRSRLEETPKPEEKKEPAKPPVAVAPKSPPEFIGLGFGPKHSHLQVLANVIGGGIQQVVLPDFLEANREGLKSEVAPGEYRKLDLVPGYLRERTRKIHEQKDVPYPDLKPGLVKDPQVLQSLAPTSYVMYHYDRPGDDFPVDLLGKIPWKVVERPDPNADDQKVVFETELLSPYYIRIRKTFTVASGAYHIGMKIEIQRLESERLPKEFDAKKAPKFRYQIVGANNLPIEGEWYVSTYRTNIVGYVDQKDRATRVLEDAQSVRISEGGERRQRSSREIRMAGTMVQYFASILCVDNLQVEGQARNFIEFIRSTPINRPIPEKSFLDDLTIRAISEEINPDKATTHQYLLYHGPVKVRLLKQLEGEKAVDPDLVDRYKNTLHLEVMTDSPMPNWLGDFASAIFWSDLVVFVTNTIHSLLHLLNLFIPVRGICIVCVTLIVRGMLFPLSRKQTISQQIMQAKMARIAPELKKLQEQFGNDFQGFNQAKTRLMLSAGINPATMMNGCFLVLMQMPIFMGLYYALQESIFFRLEPFLWIQNLGAPDMLAFWSENIPMISVPEGLGSGLYLGPYFNILPIITVSLMLFSMMKSMPTPTTDQEKMQQKTMKFMMIFMAVMFYKSPSGLCLYFMASSIWSLIEKKFMPKFVKGEDGVPIIPEQYNKPKVKREASGWRKKLGDRMKEVMEQAEKQKQYQKEKPTTPAERKNRKKKDR